MFLDNIMKIQYDKVTIPFFNLVKMGVKLMQVKIAVFGRKPTIERVKQLIEDMEKVEILPMIYSKTEEVPALFDQVFQCDVYLFTEAIAYLHVKDKIEKKRLPAIQVDFDSYMITAALYRLNTDLNTPVHRFAIDVLEDRFIKGVIDELHFEQDSIHTFIHNKFEAPEVDKLLAYYERLWKEDKIDYVLTTINEIKQQLTEKDIPASTMHPPDINITKAIKKAIALAQLRQSQNTQVVFGYVKIKDFDNITDPDTNYRMDLLEKLKRILTRFTARTDTTLIQSNDHTFNIIGTDKVLYHLKNHYREFPLLQEMKSTIKLPIYLGFGLGLNAKDAAENAEIALDSCERSEHSICYIVNERQETIGPIGIRKEIDTSSLYQALIHQAKLNNELSYNFIDFITERNNEPFSTNDVATFYQVTKRSAERTVNKLLTGNVIKVSGEERPYSKGRPRKLFTLDQ